MLPNRPEETLKDEIQELLRLVIAAPKSKPTTKQTVIIKNCLTAIEKLEDPESIKKAFAIAVAATLQRETWSPRNTTAIGKHLRDGLLANNNFPKIKKTYFPTIVGYAEIGYEDLREFAYTGLMGATKGQTTKAIQQFFGSANKNHIDENGLLANTLALIKIPAKESKEIKASASPSATIRPESASAPSTIESKQQPSPKPYLTENKPTNFGIYLGEGKVSYSSFDFDDCLSPGQPKSYHADPEERAQAAVRLAQRIAYRNYPLINGLSKESEEKKFDRICIAIGTNRQSLRRDLFNAINNGNGLSLPVYELIVSKFKQNLTNKDVDFDDYTLSDTYATAKKPGQSNEGPEDTKASGSGAKKTKETVENSQYNLRALHDEISKRLYDGTRVDADWLWDNTKVTLVYHQLQRALDKNPNAEAIDFQFYDDKKSNILQPLFDFFTSNRHLIPKQVTLTLNYYKGPDAWERFTPIEGTGEPNKNYKKTLIVLGAIVFRNSYYSNGTPYIPKKYQFPADLKDDKEIATRIEGVKKYVYELVLSGMGVGLNEAPDVIKNPELFKYTHEDFNRAVELSQTMAVPGKQIAHDQRLFASPAPSSPRKTASSLVSTPGKTN